MPSFRSGDAEKDELRSRLAEAEETINAIRFGTVDALVGATGKVFHQAGAERPYAAFFNAMNEGGVTVDRRGAVLHCNPRFANMVGHSIDSIRGNVFVSFFAPVDRKAVQMQLASSGSSSFETHLEAAGKSLPVQLSFTAMDSDGLDFSCVVITDLSDRVKSETQRIAAIAFESQEGTTITDAKGVIIRVNSAFTRFTGFTSEEVIGKTSAILHSGRHNAEFYQQLWDTLIARKSWQGEIWNRHKNGKIYPCMLSISAVCNQNGDVTNYVGVLSEITKNKEAEAEIHRLAYYDPLTELPNRRLFLEQLKQALISTSRNDRQGAVLFIDLDNFKTLNDSRGHDAGDQLLQEVGRRLCGTLREIDTVARIGGDEFLILLESLATDESETIMQVRNIGEKILQKLALPYDIFDEMVVVTASIGVCTFRDHNISVEEVLKHADLALYKAKESGRNTLRFFDPKLQAALDESVKLEKELRRAAKTDQFFLVYQPQINEKGLAISAEALLRWTHPKQGLIPPNEFIPIAEKFGLINTIGNWVLTAACAQLKTWSTDPIMRDLRIAVNVSLLQFRQVDFVSDVKRAIDQTGAHSKLLVIELTESMFIEDIDSAIKKIEALNAMGIGISIDDFGTGYSSLSYLVRLPIDQLKIDQSFIANIPQDIRNAAITKTIIDMAKNLSINVIAEGVETAEQHNFLQQNDCQKFQGFLFSQPLPIDEFEAFIKLRNNE